MTAVNRTAARPQSAEITQDIHRSIFGTLRVQFLWRTWQQRAGFDRLYPLHALRHSAITNVYRSTRDLFLAQRFARHVSPLTTTVYTHPSDEEMRGKLRDLSC